MNEYKYNQPPEEDTFEPTEFLAVGFNNELTSKVFLDPKQTKVIKRGTILTPEQRYKATWNGLESDRNIQLEIAAYPEKMRRIDELVSILNKTTNVLTYKRAMNKMTRLLQGRDAELLYPEEEAKPDYLVTT